jgi:hypothetical protein
MSKIPTNNKKLLKELNNELKALQAKLVQVNKLEGKDVYIEVKVKKNRAHAERVRQKDAVDKVLGTFFLEINITAKQENVFIPLSIASGKKTAGFMYQIEGTAPGSLVTADVETHGDEVLQVTVGTLRYAKILAGRTVSFQIRATVRGKIGKVYKIVFTRLNYKLNLTDSRYQQYLKEIHGESVKFS